MVNIRENVRLSSPNITGDGTYYYSMLNTTQVLQQKVDDGTVAFTYPLDTAVGNPIKEMEWDGVYFWTLETKTGGVIIRRWAIESTICKQQQKIELTSGGDHTYDADAFAVEHYRLSVGINNNGQDLGGGVFGTTIGLTDINVSDTSKMETGDVLTFVRRWTGTGRRAGTSYVEQGTVQSVLTSTQVRLTAPMSADPHGDGRGFRGPDISPGAGDPPSPDDVYVTKYVWLNNKNAPAAVGTPALYKIRASNGSNIVQFSGAQYSSVGGSTFYTTYNTALGIDSDNTPYNTTIKTDATRGGVQTYLLIARSSTLLFFNTTTNIIDRSMVMNNIKKDTISVWTIYDMHVSGLEPNIVVYRLQMGTTYKDSELVLQDESWSTYNYEKQLLRRVVNSIAVTAEPSIIPANGLSSYSTITATLRDQYNDTVPAGKIVTWSDDSGGDGGGVGQGVVDDESATDNFGRATNVYYAGTTEQDVKITAAVANGLI